MHGLDNSFFFLRNFIWTAKVHDDDNTVDCNVYGKSSVTYLFCGGHNYLAHPNFLLRNGIKKCRKSNAFLINVYSLLQIPRFQDLLYVQIFLYRCHFRCECRSVNFLIVFILIFVTI